MEAGLRVWNFTYLKRSTNASHCVWVCFFVCFTLSTTFHLAITRFAYPLLEDILLAIASGPHGEFQRHLYRISSLASGSAIHCLSCFLFPVFSSFLPSFRLNTVTSTLSSQIYHINCFITVFSGFGILAWV